MMGLWPGRLIAQDTGAREELIAGYVFRAAAYRGVALPGVPFDDEWGIIPSQGGRVPRHGQVVPRL